MHANTDGCALKVEVYDYDWDLHQAHSKWWQEQFDCRVSVCIAKIVKSIINYKAIIKNDTTNIFENHCKNASSITSLENVCLKHKKIVGEVSYKEINKLFKKVSVAYKY